MVYIFLCTIAKCKQIISDNNLHYTGYFVHFCTHVQYSRDIFTLTTVRTVYPVLYTVYGRHLTDVDMHRMFTVRHVKLLGIE